MPGPTHILEMEALSTEVPNDAKGLRACLRCSLIKNYGQFLESGCENCEFLNMISDPDKVEDCTTSYFEGTMAIFGPGWVAKWQRVITFLPGMYALEKMYFRHKRYFCWKYQLTVAGFEFSAKSCIYQTLKN